MAEFIDAIRAAPPWAQILVPILVVAMLAAVVESPIRRRILEARAALAVAPKRTCGWRGPVA